jgi:hypothetical protein
MSALDSLLGDLESHLQYLEESGVSQIRLDHPLQRIAPPSADPGSKPRQQIIPAPATRAPEPTPSILPRPEVKNVVQKEVAADIRFQVLTRLPACGDTVEAASTRIVLVTEAHELWPPHLSLLQEILKAIGYECTGDAEPFTDGTLLTGRGARILAMGNPALQAVSTSGMDLKIVRGMWQQSPHGKLLSTYPPSTLTDNPRGKKAAWGDLQKLLADLKLDVPEWTRQKLKKS